MKHHSIACIALGISIRRHTVPQMLEHDSPIRYDAWLFANPDQYSFADPFIHSILNSVIRSIGLNYSLSTVCQHHQNMLLGDLGWCGFDKLE